MVVAGQNGHVIIREAADALPSNARDNHVVLQMCVDPLLDGDRVLGVPRTSSQTTTLACLPCCISKGPHGRPLTTSIDQEVAAYADLVQAPLDPPPVRPGKLDVGALLLEEGRYDLTPPSDGAPQPLRWLRIPTPRASCA